MKVLVCGGREYADRALMFAYLDKHHAGTPITMLVQGDAPGADTLAAEWAQWRSVPVVSYPANWKVHGRSAGPRRNQRMLEAEKPEVVIAFPGGRGTADMVRRAKKAGIPVMSAPYISYTP